MLTGRIMYTQLYILRKKTRDQRQGHVTWASSSTPLKRQSSDVNEVWRCMSLTTSMAALLLTTPEV